MPRRPEITLRGVSGRRLVWKIYNDGLHPVLMTPIPYPLPATYKTVAVQPLILTPVTVREVERNLLLWARGRAAVMNHRRTARPMRLLTRLLESGLEVIASHVLTILGGPMERMADWENARRRPCIVSFKPGYYFKSGPAIFDASGAKSSISIPDAAILGSFENFRAIENTPRDYAY